MASLFAASTTAALALLCLAGCASTAAALPATHSAPASGSSSVPASDTAHIQGAVTCTALSVMWTELENARAAHDSGKLSDAGTSAIINTVPTTLRLLRMDKDAGLQDDLRNLAVDLTFTKPKVAGAVFDPNGNPFFTTMNQAMTACQQNGTPIWIQSPPGWG